MILISSNKRISLIPLFFFTIATLHAQETNPMYMFYDLYQYDLKMVNPALTGLSNEHSLGINYKGLQTKLPDHISSLMFSYEGRADKINSGFGAFIGTQNYPYKGDITRINLLYNYQFNLHNGASFNIGGAYNFYRTQIDYEALTLGDGLEFDGNSIDPMLSKFLENPVFKSHDMDYGVVYSHKNFVIGMSGVNILKSRRSEIFPEPHLKSWDLFSSYKFALSNEVEFIPSALIYTNFSFWNGDINSQFIFKDTYILGLSYRIIDSFNNFWNFSAGLNINDRIQIFGLLHSTIYSHYPKNSGPSFEFILRGKIIRSKDEDKI